MLKEMKKLDDAAELMQRAGSLYQESGTPDTAALVLVKAAKYVIIFWSMLFGTLYNYEFCLYLECVRVAILTKQ